LNDHPSAFSEQTEGIPFITMPTETSIDQTTTSHAKVVVIMPDAGRSFTAFGSTAQFKLEGSHTAGTLCLGFAVTPPGVGPPPHVHHTDDELFIVVEGQLEVWSDAGWTVAPAGSVVYLPRGSRHTFRNAGATPSRHWVLTAPSGFDDFYRGAAEIFAAGGTPDFQKLGALAAKHGYEILPPGTGSVM
jgi:mannose-6-phosphate isomerase-like protein (cupin superfamily)